MTHNTNSPCLDSLVPNIDNQQDNGSAAEPHNEIQAQNNGTSSNSQNGGQAQQENQDEIDKQTQIGEENANLVILSQRIEKLKIENSLPNETSHAISKQKNSTLEILKSLEAPLTLAKDAIAQENPNIILTNRTRVKLDMEVLKHEYKIPGISFFVYTFFRCPANWFNNVKYSRSTSRKVIAGLMASFITSIGVTIFVSFGFVVFMWAKRNLIGLEANNKELIKIESRIDDVIKSIDKNDREIGIAQKKPGVAESNLALGANSNQPIDPTLALLHEKKRLEDEKEMLSKEKRSTELEIKAIKEELILDQNRLRLFTNLIWVTSAGIIGSIISIMTRIEDFSNKKYNDPVIPFLIGAFKPIIGGGLGIFILFLVSSDFITIKGITDTTTSVPKVEKSATISATEDGFFSKKLGFVLAVSFLIGFSERLAKDVLSKAEAILGGTSHPKSSPPKQSE